MTEDLAQVALVYLLPAGGAGVEMLLFRDVPAAVKLAGNWRAEIG